MSMRRTPEWHQAYQAKRAKAVAKADGLSNVELVNKTWLGDMPIPTYLAPVPTLTETVKHDKDVYHVVTMCRAGGLPAPIPEFEFHPTRKWRFDYAFPLAKIAVEIDGGLFSRVPGGHNRGAYIRDTMEKTNAAAKLGWRILRYTPDNVSQLLDDLGEMM